MRSPVTTWLLVCSLVVLAGCGADDQGLGAPDEDAGRTIDDGGAAEDGAADDGPPGGAPDPGASGPGAAVPDEVVAAAVADLADHAEVPEEDVEVVSAEPVTWSSGALGCPEPDRMYTQALVPGYRIVLRVGGDEVAYHGAEDGPPARCDDPVPPVDPAG